MSENIVVIDFAGTLVKASVIEEANELRSAVLKRGIPSRSEHADPEGFYQTNREFVQRLTGLSEKMVVSYRANDLAFMKLSGKEVQNQIATNLFQLGMYIVAKKYGLTMIPQGLIEQLQRIKRRDYKLAIVSGVRTDIISGMLQIAKVPVEFDYLFGQPPILGMENQEQDVKQLQQQGVIVYTIGDKLSDLERVPAAKKIFVTWGHPAGGEEKIADYVINKPGELGEIIV